MPTAAERRAPKLLAEFLEEDNGKMLLLWGGVVVLSLLGEAARFLPRIVCMMLLLLKSYQETNGDMVEVG